jgi:hypothetical protein
VTPNWYFIMSVLRDRTHRLVDCLSEAELAETWTILLDFYLDRYMLRAIAASKRSFQPGDSLTREEALRVLALL